MLLSKSVATNETALNIIFTKMMGIKNSTLLLTDFPDEPTGSSDRMKTKKSILLDTMTAAGNKRGPLCREISKLIILILR